MQRPFSDVMNDRKFALLLRQTMGADIAPYGEIFFELRTVSPAAADWWHVAPGLNIERLRAGKYMLPEVIQLWQASGFSEANFRLMCDVYAMEENQRLQFMLANNMLRPAPTGGIKYEMAPGCIMAIKMVESWEAFVRLCEKGGGSPLH